MPPRRRSTSNGGSRASISDKLVRRAGIVGSIARFWQRSYAADYVGLLIILVGYVLMKIFVEPFHRMFSLDNIAIQYPHALVERVPPFCTETDHHVLHDGWRSFPSGHSSFAFSGLGFLSIFLSGQMHVFRPRTDLSRVLVALAPLLGAALIAISRCEDYRHDVYDVTIGSLLGVLVAYFSYRRYYPGLRSVRCDEPFPSRADVFRRRGTASGGFSKVKHDDDDDNHQDDDHNDDDDDDADVEANADRFSVVVGDLAHDVEALPLRDAR
ncbi:MAG: hypothetical protein M1825_001924 [Sarcosagium campestre]|nr:MAG: hypothetical protein M1825_001924 [Sarcosagium campestre]